MDLSFPVIHGDVYRDSVKENDFTVLELICNSTEYDGYIQPYMPIPDGGNMHPELAVCKKAIHKIIQHIGSEALPDPSGRSFQGIFDDMKLRMLSQQLRRRYRSPRTSPIPFPRWGLSGSQSPSSPGSQQIN
jgi:hypothetical protein